MKTQQLNKQEVVEACPATSQVKFDSLKAGTGYARHGDLFLFKADKLPEGAVPVSGNVVLQAGNVHGFVGEATMFEAPSMSAEFGPQRFLVVTGPAKMSMHIEHGDAPLPVGITEARRKREGRSDFTRYVVD